MKTTYFKKYLFLILVITIAFSACEDDYVPFEIDEENKPSVPAENGLYLGLIGFNQSLTEKNLALLTGTSSAAYYTFIDELKSASGTVLYHAVNEALDNISKANLPDDIVNVSIVTFTDGLDLGSYILNNKYASGKDYLTAVNGRILNSNVKGVKISAYAIGTRGNDVTDIDQFQANLKSLSSSDNNAMEISNISEATNRFKEIASSLTSITNKQMLDLTIPAPNPGTKVRFTLDPVFDANNSQIYIEGTFTSKDNAFFLTNVSYHGINCQSGTSVKGKVSGINITFSFEDITQASNQTTVDFDVKQWSFVISNSSWQINSEFNQNENTETIIENNSAAIVLVLDCSSSLGDDFDDMKRAAKSFIDVLLVEIKKD